MVPLHSKTNNDTQQILELLFPISEETLEQFGI